MNPSERPRTKAGQREKTRRALLAQARRLFAARGFHDVSLAEIVAAAGVTKGALYHQFSSKDELFGAVLVEVHEEVAVEIASAVTDADAWTQLLAGCRRFLETSTAPGIQQIMLIDAPVVLGWGIWREIDAETSVRQLEDVLHRLIDEGTIVDQPLQPLVHLLSGAMNELALWIAGTENREASVEASMRVLNRVLESLRSPE